MQQAGERHSKVGLGVCLIFSEHNGFKTGKYMSATYVRQCNKFDMADSAVILKRIQNG